MNNKSELEFRVILENDKMVQKFKKKQVYNRVIPNILVVTITFRKYP